DRVLLQAEGARRLRVVDLLHPLDLDEVIARPERPELGPAALPGPLRDLGRIGALEPPALLDARQVGRLAKAVADRPGGSLGEQLPLARALELEVRPARSDPGRYRPEQRLDDLADPVGHLPGLDVGAQQPDPAVDVVSDPAG